MPTRTDYGWRIDRRFIFRLVIAVAGAALLPSIVSSTEAAAITTQRAVVDHVADGDTIKVVVHGRGEYVRFVGIDTPEVYDGVDCGGPEASASMKRLLQAGDHVRLVRDLSQDNRDVYGRLLRYVMFEGSDLGRKQVTKGWARVYIFDRPFDRLAAYDSSRTRRRNPVAASGVSAGASSRDQRIGGGVLSALADRSGSQPQTRHACWNAERANLSAASWEFGRGRPRRRGRIRQGSNPSERRRARGRRLRTREAPGARIRKRRTCRISGPPGNAKGPHD